MQSGAGVHRMVCFTVVALIINIIIDNESARKWLIQYIRIVVVIGSDGRSPVLPSIV
jgi:hypothetical protein